MLEGIVEPESKPMPLFRAFLGSLDRPCKLARFVARFLLEFDPLEAFA